MGSRQARSARKVVCCGEDRECKASEVRRLNKCVDGDGDGLGKIVWAFAWGIDLCPRKYSDQKVVEEDGLDSLLDACVPTDRSGFLNIRGTGTFEWREQHLIHSSRLHGNVAPHIGCWVVMARTSVFRRITVSVRAFSHCCLLGTKTGFVAYPRPQISCHMPGELGSVTCGTASLSRAEQNN